MNTNVESLRICIVGKYPPIEGGVSATTYWLARGLAARGHEIHVVTNADEVEDRYRMQLGSDDATMLQPHFSNGGSVRVHHVESFHPREMFYIPLANPFVTRLASLTIDVVRRYRCEAVLGYYFEPYGVASWFAANRCGVPLLLKHAGSDLGRLAQVPDLGLVYKEILRDAAAVLTGPVISRRFVGMGVSPSRIVHTPPYFHDQNFFTSSGSTLNIDATAVHDGAGSALKPQDPTAPIIGIYGKVGITKGTFDLITALGCLAEEGRSFRFAAMVGPEFGVRLRASLIDAGIAAQTAILPYLPNWRVPEFIRACDAVCFLERDFPIAIHGPTIPREILECGTCLILSQEIADKQFYRERLKHEVNLLLVTDPRNTDELCAALRTVIDKPELMRQIGEQGREVIAESGGYERFIGSWEELLERTARQLASADPAGRPQVCRQALEVSVPDLLAYAEKTAPSLVNDFLNTTDSVELPGCAYDFCDYLADKLTTAFGETIQPIFAEALRYTVARLKAGFDVADDPPLFPFVDDLHNPAFSFDDVAELYPVRSNTVFVEEFRYDVCNAFGMATHSAAATNPFDRIPLRSRLVLFQRTANLAPCELDIGPGTLELLEVCDGRHTTNEVIKVVRSTRQNGDDVTDHVLSALRSLYGLGVIVFGRVDLAWGWRKGARSDPAALPQLRSNPILANRAY